MHQSQRQPRDIRKPDIPAEKNEMRERLRSEEEYALTVRRMIELESVFGQVKNNRGFRRFLLRGLDKVSLEVGWLCLAHNLLKKLAIDQKRKRDEAGNASASFRLAISASFQLLIQLQKGFWDSPKHLIIEGICQTERSYTSLTIPLIFRKLSIRYDD